MNKANPSFVLVTDAAEDLKLFSLDGSHVFHVFNQAGSQPQVMFNGKRVFQGKNVQECNDFLYFLAGQYMAIGYESNGETAVEREYSGAADLIPDHWDRGNVYIATDQDGAVSLYEERPVFTGSVWFIERDDAEDKIVWMADNFIVPRTSLRKWDDENKRWVIPE